jgi:competence protein ComEC
MRSGPQAVPYLVRSLDRWYCSAGYRAHDRALRSGIAQFGSFRLGPITSAACRSISTRSPHDSRPRKPVWQQKLAPPRAGVFFALIFRAAELSVISAVMQFGMALIMAYYFRRPTAVATFANLLAVPILQVLMPAAALAISVSYISLSLARIPAAIAAFALQAIARTVGWLGGMRIADVHLPTPAASTIVCAGLTIFVAVLLLRRKKADLFAAVTLLAVGAVSVWELGPREQIHPRVLEMTAIDVGQGDSLLLVLPDKRKLLVDAGGLPFWTRSQMDIGEDVVSPYLWSRGITYLDAIALTHAHADHMGGLPAVIANFHRSEFWLPQGIPDEEIRFLLEQAARLNVKVVYRRAGDSFAYAGAQIRVPVPDPNFPIRVAHRNDESLVMKIS